MSRCLATFSMVPFFTMCFDSHAVFAMVGTRAGSREALGSRPHAHAAWGRTTGSRAALSAAQLSVSAVSAV